MHPQIKLVRATRKWLLNLIEGLSAEELNKIPAGFNNNIIWNTGHLLASHQSIFYIRAGLKPLIEEKYFLNFKPESKPGEPVSDADIVNIKALLFSTLDQFEAGIEENIFINYPTWTTRSGIEINSIEDALRFWPFHEGIHVGYVMALKRAIR